METCLELLSTKSATHNQYCITGGIEEFFVFVLVFPTIKDQEDARVVIAITSPSNLSFWSMQMAGRSWKMRVDYHKLNQMVGNPSLTSCRYGFFIDLTNTLPWNLLFS